MGALVALLALVAYDSLGGAVAAAGAVSTGGGLVVTLACAARTAVDRVAEVTARAFFAVRALGVVAAGLDARRAVQAALAVTIALARCKSISN